MNEDLSLSAAGLNLIKHFEGCREEVGPDQYRTTECPKGTMTIGHGHTLSVGRRFTPEDVWTSADCERVLLYDLTHTVDRLRKMTRVRLTQPQFDALTSLIFNCGHEAITNSELMRKLNVKNYRGAADEFMRWNRTNGQTHENLTRRRERERLLFNGAGDPEYHAQPNRTVSPSEGEMPQLVDDPEATIEPTSERAPIVESESRVRRGPDTLSELASPPTPKEEANG